MIRKNNIDNNSDQMNDGQPRMRFCRTSETKDGSPCFLLFRLHPSLVSEGR